MTMTGLRDDDDRAASNARSVAPVSGILQDRYVPRSFDMNIFYALSEGRGRLTETNLSAFAAFLLDPHQLHGLSDVFLRAFLREVARGTGEPERFADVLSSPLLNVKSDASRLRSQPM